MRKTAVSARLLVGVLFIMLAASCTAGREPVPGELLQVRSGGGLFCQPANCPTDVVIKADGSWTISTGSPATVTSGQLDPAVKDELTRRINAEIGTLTLVPRCTAPCSPVLDGGSTTATFTGPIYAITVSTTSHVLDDNALFAYVLGVTRQLRGLPTPG